MQRRRRLISLAGAAMIAAALFPAVDSAAPLPGAPLPVAPGVPDQGRAWELVTSPEANSALFVQADAFSVDGSRAFYQTSAVLPQAQTNESNEALDLAVRGADGWTDSPSPRPVPNAYAGYPSFGYEPLGFDPSLESVVWLDEITPRPEGAEAGAGGYFLRGPDGRVAFLNEEEGFITPFTLVGGGRVVFPSQRHLLPADAGRTSGHSLYELMGSSLRLVDVDNQGALLSDCGSTLNSQAGVSHDGQRIFFSTSPGCSGPPRVYLRANGATTTDISTPQCDLGDCYPSPEVTFAGATPSGSSAFLRSEQRLTDEDSNSRADLYRYDVASGELTLISGGAGGASDVVPSAKPVSVSTDGSRAYFYGKPAGSGSTEHLYLADAKGVHLLPGAAPYEFLQISDDGRYALLSTKESLLAEDTDERSDAYRFDADDDSVALISTGPDGGNGPVDVRIEPGWLASRSFPSNPYRAMSADGSRIFFTTSERLLPEDHNEASDVYEWANGNLGLISSGSGGSGSGYLGTSVDGNTVFFWTSDTLLPRDRDGGDRDIYAARIGGGFPEPSPARECEGSSCQPVRGQATRPAAATARPLRGGIRLAPIGPASRRRMAATGWITLLAEVPQAGKLSAKALTRVGHGPRTVASASVKVAQAGSAQLRMRLAAAAREKLAAGRGLQLRLLLRFSHPALVRRVSLTLRGHR